jgi:hypothetical protein
MKSIQFLRKNPKKKLKKNLYNYEKKSQESLKYVFEGQDDIV